MLVCNKFQIQFRYTRFLYFLRSVTGGYATPYPLTLRRGPHGDWLHRVWSFPFHPSIKVECKAWQAASTVFEVASMTREGIEPSLPASVALAQPTVPLVVRERARWCHLAATFCVVAQTRDGAAWTRAGNVRASGQSHISSVDRREEVARHRGRRKHQDFTGLVADEACSVFSLRLMRGSHF